jgi:hypothetical protein
MYTNANITLYACPDGKYTRHEINGVFWEDVKQSNIIKSGLSTADSVKVFIPVGSLPGEIKFTTGKDLIVKGGVDFEVDNTSQQTISASLKTMKETYDRVVTVNVVDDKLYGSPRMQHIQLSCK